MSYCGDSSSSSSKNSTISYYGDPAIPPLNPKMYCTLPPLTVPDHLGWKTVNNYDKENRGKPIDEQHPITPEKRFSIRFDALGRRWVEFSPTTKKLIRLNERTKCSIYSHKNELTGERYAGKSFNMIRRIDQELSDCHNEDLQNALEETPEHMSVGLVGFASPTKAALIENTVILGNATISKGYNKRCGGGGGTKNIKKKPVKLSDKTIAKIEKLIYKSFAEINWRSDYTHTKNGHIRLPTRGEEFSQKNQVYLLRHFCPWTKVQTIYVGHTGMTVRKRLASHQTHINNLHKPKYQNKQEIHKLFHHQMKFCSIAILNTDEIQKKYPRISPRQFEVLTKQALDKLKGVRLTNKNNGGGGGFTN